MALTLELEPLMEARLHEVAARRGMNAEKYARMVLEVLMRAQVDPTEQGLPFYITATPEEWRREFHAWIDSHSENSAPPIPLEALRRENLYEDRGL
jgi:hypothetical protein